MRRIHLKLNNARSDILVGAGSYGSLAAHLERAGLEEPFFVVSQPRILSAIGKRPLDRNPVATIPDGERAKNLRTVSRLLDQMVALGLTRQSTVVAVGGGVVGDVAAFAASVYLRGIAVVQVPTTLLAQVDSSVGGKTGVNHRAGKNLIGTFYHPRLVVVDPLLLASLPAREYRSGLYEVIKYGIICDPLLFDEFERHHQRILDRDPTTLEKLVSRCLQIKVDVVQADEKESNLRRILNFGHTLGHAIETASGYRKIRHGEAVAWGMIGATRLGEKLGRIADAEAARIEAGIRSIGKLPDISALSTAILMQALRHDKKIRDGSLHFVLPRRVGKVDIQSGISPRLVRSVIRSLS